MTVTAAVASGRQAAEKRMLDTFVVEQATGGYAYDEDSGTDVEVFAALFTTKGRVKSSGLAVREAEAGARTVVSVTRELHIPVDSPAIPTGAVARCTAVDPSSDPTLLGARLRLSGPAPGSQTTARRLEVTEVLS